MVMKMIYGHLLNCYKALAVKSFLFFLNAQSVMQVQEALLMC